VLFSIGGSRTVGKLSGSSDRLDCDGLHPILYLRRDRGLFPNKGGTSIYGAIAWVRYGKLIAPISVWWNWFAWSPVQATLALAAGYTLPACTRPTR